MIDQVEPISVGLREAGSTPNPLGLRDPSQWITHTDPNRVDAQGKPIELHRLNPDIPIPIEQGMLLIDKATVASKILLRKDERGREKQREFRLVAGWPGCMLGEAAIFEVKPEDEKSPSDRGKLAGFAYGPNFSIAEDAYTYLEELGWQDSPTKPQ